MSLLSFYQKSSDRSRIYSAEWRREKTYNLEGDVVQKWVEITLVRYFLYCLVALMATWLKNCSKSIMPIT